MNTGPGRFVRCFGAALLLLATSVAHGARCSISVPGLNFGNYAPISANAVNPLNGVTTLTIFCRATLVGREIIPIVISLSSGSGAAGNPYNPRQMRSISGANLNYNLYWNAARTQIAGNGASGTSRRSLTAEVSCTLGLLLCTSVTLPQTIYGRVFAGQDVGVGSYMTAPPVTVTVSF